MGVGKPKDMTSKGFLDGKQDGPTAPVRIASVEEVSHHRALKRQAMKGLPPQAVVAMHDPLRRKGFFMQEVHGLVAAPAPEEWDSSVYMRSNGAEQAAEMAGGGGGGKGEGSGSSSDEGRDEAPGPECVVYVRGFQGTVADEATIKQRLRECFGDNGEVARIQLPCNRETGMLKGFGFVHFRDADAAAAVLKLGRAGKFSLHGQQLQIRSLQPNANNVRRGDSAATDSTAATAREQPEQQPKQHKAKRLPGSIVQNACMLCRIEGATCDICREYPTHLLSLHRVANPFTAPLSSPNKLAVPNKAGVQQQYHNPHSSVEQTPAYNPMYPDNACYDDEPPSPPSPLASQLCFDASFSTYRPQPQPPMHIPTFASAEPISTPSTAMPVVSASASSGLTSMSSANNPYDLSHAASSAAPAAVGISNVAEVEALRAELCEVLRTSGAEMEAWMAERNALQAELAEARALAAAAAAAARETTRTNKKGKDGGGDDAALEAKVRAKVAAEVAAAEAAELDELEALLTAEAASSGGKGGGGKAKVEYDVKYAQAQEELNAALQREKAKDQQLLRLQAQVSSLQSKLATTAAAAAKPAAATAAPAATMSAEPVLVSLTAPGPLSSSSPSMPPPAAPAAVQLTSLSSEPSSYMLDLGLVR